MQLRAGDRLRCSNPECRLEIIVLEVPSEEEHNRLLECWCGWPMKKRYVEPSVTRMDLERMVAGGL
ncbi:MAG TPA: hypothetical protein VMH31_12490 [Methylomirabilota bacterium]|nr:hypothetical protein [Methylomirabilota bacterium]